MTPIAFVCAWCERSRNSAGVWELADPEDLVDAEAELLVDDRDRHLSVSLGHEFVLEALLAVVLFSRCEIWPEPDRRAALSRPVLFESA